MAEQSQNTRSDDAISLKEILHFLIQSWKTIALAGLLGWFVSMAYLRTTPYTYQATAQIQLAQIVTNANANLIATNVEDPKILLARLRFPTVYSNAETKACGLDDKDSSSEILVNLVKFSEVKGAPSIVELKTVGPSKDIAGKCAEALFKKIKESQNEIMSIYAKEARALLVEYQKRLMNAQSIIVKADKSSASLSAVYLSTRDEVKFLTEEIFRLNTFIASIDTRQAKLVAPIYQDDAPVFPKKKNILIAGLISGIFFGFLIVLVKRGLKNNFLIYKN